jgi:hypothetical protein
MKKLTFRPSLCLGIPATFKRLLGRMVALQVIILLMAGLGCGGGTSGSGVKSFEGKISRRNGASVPNAQISIESTGESSISDSNGNFALQSSVSGDSVDFTIEAESASQRFSVNGLSDEDVRVALDIVLEGPGIAPAVHNLSMRAWFVGLCEPFFDNGDVIRQQALVPRGAICSLNVELLGDGQRLSSARSRVFIVR